MEIPLTLGLKTVIDDADWPAVSGFPWKALRRVSHGVVRYYAGVTVREGAVRRTVLMHRVLMGEPAGLAVDHKDGDSLNNRRSNLRVATTGQNRANSRKHKAGHSKYKGVSKQRGRWSAQVWHDKVRRFLGYYAVEEEAARAYDAAARRLFGEFAKTNFPEETSVQQAAGPPA